MIGAIGLGPSYAADFIPPHYLKIEAEDTLSQALDRHFPKRTWRIWGRNGALAKIQAMNPSIRDVNRVFPGMVVDIGEFAKNSAIAANVPDRAPAALLLEESTQTTTPPSQEREIVHSTPAPAPKEVASISFSPDRYGWFSVEPVFSFSALDSTDKSSSGNATFLSTLNSGFVFSWGQHWSNRFQTSLLIGARRESYAYQSAGITVDHTSRNLSQFGVLAQWSPFRSNEFRVDSSLRLRQEIFVRANGFTSLSLDAVRVPELSLGAQYHLLELWPFSFSLNAHGLAYAPAKSTTYNARMGTGFKFGTTLGMVISKSLRMNGEIFYSSRSQESSIATQNQKNIGFTLGLSYRMKTPDPNESQEDDLP
ncbi:MAG: hypothetical protein A2X94_12440 [Bdellovibrionales bacterium GWB1_55_8]|nr:MAG: hypothetical protein A2X94_12440 [Bdellovibrionales bacterium GWB1_55_8]